MVISALQPQDARDGRCRIDADHAATVVRYTNTCAMNLSGAARTTQLLGQLDDLGSTGRTNGVTLA